MRPPALALPFARPRTSLAACGAHVARYARPPMPKTPQYLPALPVCACPRRRSAHRTSWWRGKCAGPLRLPVPPLRPGGGPANRGSAVVTPNRSPRSALGNPPLNHIQEDLLHLLAGLLDLLEPDFASTRGACREPLAQRLRARDGEPAQASVSEPSRPPKHTPSPTHRAWPIPHVGRRPRGRERAAAASPQRRKFGIDSSLRWRRETVGAGRGAAEAAGGGLAGGGDPHGSGGGSRRPGRDGWPRESPGHRRPRMCMCMLVPMHGPLHLNIIVSLCGALVCMLSFLWLFPSYETAGSAWDACRRPGRAPEDASTDHPRVPSSTGARPSSGPNFRL